MPSSLPILVVDDDANVLEAVARACAWVEPSRPVIPLPKEAEARTYLQDSAAAGRCPSVILVRINDKRPDAFAFARWIRSQGPPVGTAWLVLVTNRTRVDLPDDAQLVVGSAVTVDGLTAAVSIALEATVDRAHMLSANRDAATPDIDCRRRE